MLTGTCAICEGLVRPAGELHYLWLDWCDTNYDLNKERCPSKEAWFKNNKRTLKGLFFKEWGQYPPYPTWPEEE